ncbi:MAG TPA: pilus assembly PilX N-terminal domain-containing protein [Candidatus Saccharimonadales bacterium]|nr:pilus assembly PilX N-terminal domain-containing protein [Candidatus Saccharimonadales bacterium]
MKRQQLEEQGFASIIIVMTLVIILGLMAIGFGRLMRSEQRSALDRQLSTQAYYAAESGVKDAIYAIQKGFATSNSNSGQCLTSADLGSGFSATGNVLDATTGTQYTCIMVETEPTSLEYNPISTDTGNTTGTKYISLVGKTMDRSSDQIIGSLKVSWQGKSGGASFGGPNCDSSGVTFPVSTGWTCGPGVIRITLTPFANSFDRGSLVNGTYTVFLYPQNNSTAGTLGSAIYVAGQANMNQQGAIVSGNCNSANSSATTPRQCNVLINLANLSSRFFVSVKSFYVDSDVVITPYADATGNTPMRLSGAQATIDSTGKSQDVLRRIKVAVPEFAQNYFPEGAIDAAGQICKLLQVAPGTPAQDAGCDTSP